MEKTNRQKQKSNTKYSKIFTFKLFNKLLYLIIILSGVYYLVNVNDLSIKGVKLQEFKKEINNLVEENNNLELEVMAFKSYNDLSQKAEELKMVAIDKVHYIEGSTVVVVKK